MEEHEVGESVISIVKTLLKEENVDLQSGRETLSSWNSLKHVEIVFAVEDELSVSFSEEEMARLDSVGKIVQTVLEKNAT